MINFWHGSEIKELESRQVLVFGSNPEGRHGLGMAKIAKERFGAEYGVGRGHTGQTYALVTKNLTAGYLEASTGILYEKEGRRSLTLDQIEENIKEFYQYAEDTPHLEFVVCYNLGAKNLNGYSAEEFADCFTCAKIPSNVVFHESFKDVLITTSGFRGLFAFLSNFKDLDKPFTSNYKDRKLTFNSVEHFYQAMKFKDPEIAERVAKHPKKGLKSFVASLDIYQRDDWEKIKLDVMEFGLRYKFSKHNPQLRQRLIDTGGINLVEYNWWGDEFFGVCKKTGKGHNHLGMLLEKIREEIVSGTY